MWGRLHIYILTPEAVGAKPNRPEANQKGKAIAGGQQGPNMLRRLVIGTLLASRVPIQVGANHDSQGALGGIWGSIWPLGNWFFSAGGAHLPAQT